MNTSSQDKICRNMMARGGIRVKGNNRSDKGTLRGFIQIIDLIIIRIFLIVWDFFFKAFKINTSEQHYLIKKLN